jgi:RNA polymerase sigma factor (sigma-70 family)
LSDLKVEKHVLRPNSELIESCLEGDQDAWAELIDRFQRLIYSVAHAMCRSSEDAADVFQQVCMELYQRLPEVRDTETLPAWLITVTKRQAIASLKSTKALVPLIDEHPHGVDHITMIENEHLVERGMLGLPEQCRQLLDLLYRQPSELSYAEIAQRLGVPVSSIGPMRARCLAKLRKLLS